MKVHSFSGVVSKCEWAYLSERDVSILVFRDLAACSGQSINYCDVGTNFKRFLRRRIQPQK